MSARCAVCDKPTKASSRATISRGEVVLFLCNEEADECYKMVRTDKDLREQLLQIKGKR